MMWAWEEPNSAQLLLQLPLTGVNAFLLDVVQPRLDRIKRRGEARYWTCARMGQATPRDGVLLLHLRPTARVGLTALEAGARGQLAAPLRAAGGRFLEPLQDVMPREYARESFGGDRGLRIFKLFDRSNSTAGLRLLRAQRRPSALGGYEVGLGSYFFFRDTAGLDDKELLEGLERWLDFFGKKLIPDPRELSAFIEQAADQIQGNVQLRRLLERLTADGWKKTLRSPLRDPLIGHEGSMRRIGRLLRSNEPNFRPSNPKIRVFFHSYLHAHYMRLGLGGKKELLLIALLKAWFGVERKAHE